METPRDLGTLDVDLVHLLDKSLVSTVFVSVVLIIFPQSFHLTNLPEYH